MALQIQSYRFLEAPLEFREDLGAAGCFDFTGSQKMTHAEFDRLTQGMHARSVDACRLILVEGLSINAAARQTGSSPGNVSRMLRKIPRELCPCCGQPVMH